MGDDGASVVRREEIDIAPLLGAAGNYSLIRLLQCIPGHRPVDV